jgi:outer membrane protein
MRAIKTVITLLVGLLAVAVPAQEKEGGSLWHKLGKPYEAPPVPENRYEDSRRLGALIRGGQLYLSLDDAIALAVENNLDVAVQRYLPVFAAADAWRAKAGTALRGLQLTVREGPQGVGGPASSVLTGGIDNTNSQADVTLAPGQVPGISTTAFSSGPRLPSFEPTLTGQAGWNHRTAPQTSLFSFGIPYLVTETTAANAGFLRGFSSGAQLNVAFNNNWQRVNTGRLDYNPYTVSSLGFTVSQPLLQGFGRTVNQRYLKIARNNLDIADLTFRQQVIATVSGVIRLYYDLVSVTQDVEVKRQALKRAETLLENNRTQVEVGTLPEIEMTRAQAEVARSQQALTNAESLVLQQEVILKNFLSRKGTADPDLRDAHIVATDRIQIPATEEPRDANQLVEQAFRDRPDYAQALLQVDNARMALKGSKNALLPQLDLVGTMQNNALAGTVNSIPAPGTPVGTPRTPDPQYLGGYGTALAQIFRRNYPDYGIFLQLNIPLSNSQARADMQRDSAQLNQAELRIEQLKHQVRTDVEASLLALSRARAGWEAARQTRILQEDALAAEQERYSVGATTSFFVIQSQRDLAQARADEVLAESLYAKARTSLERATGQVLTSHNVQIDEAVSGEVKRPPRPQP